MTYSSDERAVFAQCAERSGVEEITDGCARVIASWYHNGGTSDTYAFVSTGAIQSEDLWRQFTNDGALYEEERNPDVRQALDALGTYLLARIKADNTGQVPGWSNMWVR
jgi:hypothetical protein